MKKVVVYCVVARADAPRHSERRNIMKAWLYYRLSRDEEMNSLQNQRQILIDYAEQNGHEIVGESFDDNVSE